MPQEKFFGFWLMLAESDHKLVSDIISRLSITYLDGSLFIPHLSVYPSVAADLPRLIRILKGVRTKGPIDCKVTGLGYEERWSRTLFIDLERNASLTNINVQMQVLLGGLTTSKSIDYHPHISLIYDKTMDVKTKQGIIDRLTPPTTLTVDRLAIVDPHGVGTNWRDYTKWEVVHQIQL